MAWKLMLASAVAMAARSAPYVVAKPAGKSFVAHASDLLPLKPTPINPDWIVSGNPQARTAE
ncbi:cupin, partial [Rhizobium ruizarguesonis]